MSANSQSNSTDANLAIVLPTLAGGGAERVATNLANHWTEQGRHVSVITMDAISELHYPLDERVERFGLGLLRESHSFAAALLNNKFRVRRLRCALAATEARQVVSFTDITNVTTLLACRRLDVEVIVSERTDPRHQRLGRAWSFLRKRTYGRAAAIIVQTKAVATWAESQKWNRPIHVIPNAAPSAVRTASADTPDGPSQCRVVALGRLSREKGFDLLIEAFSKIAGRHPSWRLEIHGEGPQRAKLTKLACERGIADQVSMPGWTRQPDRILHDAGIFVLPSRYEGFPNALLEAMAIGLPCISFDCDSGPREIIRAGVDGMLVPAADTGQLAAALDELISDPAMRRKLGEKATEVAQRFSQDDFYRRWDDVLNSVGGG